jgi:hypothetical protein
MPKLLSSGQKDSIIHALGQGLKVLLCKGFKAWLAPKYTWTATASGRPNRYMGASPNIV